MSYYEIRYLNQEKDETSWFVDFEDEAQEAINELLEEGRTVLSVIECTNVTRNFRTELDE